MAPSPEPALDAYVAAWNEPDGDTRRRLLASALADDAAFEGPTGTFRGRDAIARLVDAVRSRMPGATVVRVGPADDDGGLIRFRWQIRSPDGDVVLEGLDEVEVDGAGKVLLVRMRTAVEG